MRSYLAWIYEKPNGEGTYVAEFNRDQIKDTMNKRFQELKIDIDAESFIKEIEAEFARAIRRT